MSGQPRSTSRQPHHCSHRLWVPALMPRHTGCQRTCLRAAVLSNTMLLSCAEQTTAALLHCSTHALQHTCIAAHPGGRCHVAVDLYPYLQERGWDGYRPLNGCSQGLVVRGISPPEPCLYTCHTKVFSKVSNSLPIHQYFPAASPYGAQSGGWIGMTD